MALRELTVEPSIVAFTAFVILFSAYDPSPASATAASPPPRGRSRRYGLGLDGRFVVCRQFDRSNVGERTVIRNGRLNGTCRSVFRICSCECRSDSDSSTDSLSAHSDTVTSVTFSLDGSRIYSESENEKLVWNVGTRETIRDAMWAPPEVITHTCPDGRWFVTTEADNVVLVDLEYKNVPNEKARRKTKASFDSSWHQEQATAMTTAHDWYAATFHFALLMKNDPDQTSFYDGLQSSYAQLVSQFADKKRDVDSHLSNLVKESLQRQRGSKLP